MSQSKSTSRPLQPMDPRLRDIQPGGGVVIRLEQKWGNVRRWWLKLFRRGWVQRMESLRQGDFNPCPHDVLDSRDLKFHRNQGGWYWDSADDPFRWRDRIPFARVGLAELLVIGGGFTVAGLVFAWAGSVSTGTVQLIAWFASAVLLVIAGLIAWFFRDPPREAPAAPGLVISPADGKIVDIEELDNDDHVGGPAVKIGIFLSIFNVHINRAPVSGRVIGLAYRSGKYLNALRPESARENEQLAVMIETDDGHHRGIVVRQITGAIARRIVCWLKPGDDLKRGEQFGMIKLGSRTELVLPKEACLTIHTQLGDRVKAGTSILADFGTE
ncbi:MAG: phosphatidylserine decarboxylase family protein [Fuerstiella sp.]|nr:phosphatidylserine decarboxylase family protein [Fuerstiella sp.]